jgi:hypothetical protein
MPFKSLTVLGVFITCVFNSFSNVGFNGTSVIKLPNTVMYELIDCVNTTNTLDDYMERYLLYPVKDKQLVPFYYAQEEKRAMATDSANKLVLAQIVDSLRKYAIKKADLVTETFYWVYQEYRDGATNASTHNLFEFKKGEAVFGVTFHELRSTKEGWRIVGEVKFEKRNASAKDKPITCSSTLSVDPITQGPRLAELIQVGKLEELFQYFPTEKTLKFFYKNNPQELKDVLSDNEETKNFIRQRFYRMKPGAYKVHNEYIKLGRNSANPNDMDNGRYQFTLNVENSTKWFNLVFFFANGKIYVWKFYESEY